MFYRNGTKHLVEQYNLFIYKFMTENLWNEMVTDYDFNLALLFRLVICCSAVKLSVFCFVFTRSYRSAN